MLKKTVFSALLIFSLFTRPGVSELVILDVKTASKLPVHAEEFTQAKANIIAFVGGKGLKNRKGRSKNYLVKVRSTLISDNLNFYLFPNWSADDTAFYARRASNERTERILNLLSAINKRNALPTYLVGFSRGSVDVASFAKRHPKKIRGIVIASGVYKNTSKKAAQYSMEKIIGKKVGVRVLIVHHKKDKCKVTPFKYAKKFATTLDAPNKTFLSYDGGTPSGKPCGPLHHHGFEQMEETVARDIAKWIIADVKKKKVTEQIQFERR